MQPLVDFTDTATITDTTYPNTPHHKVVAPNDNYFIVGQIAIGADATFIKQGKLNIKINGNPINSKSNALTEIGIVSNITIDFKEHDFIYVEPNSSIEINARMTTGTGTLQTSVTGVFVTRNEFQAALKKFLGIPMSLEEAQRLGLI